MTAVEQGGTIKLGTDFVDAITGKPASHGTITVAFGNVGHFYSHKVFPWLSTRLCVESEHYLRILAKVDHATVIDFMSQATSE